MFPMATPSVHTGVICIPLRPVATHTHTHTRYYYYLKTGSQITEPGVRGQSGQGSSGGRDVAGAAGSPLRHFGPLLLTARPPSPAAARFHNLMLSFLLPSC